MLKIFWTVIITSLFIAPRVVYSAERRLIFLGDSITEGYNLSKEDAYPFLIESILHQEGFKNIKSINAGISGSTTASGLSRFKWYLKEKPEVLILALGANDGLRGLDAKKTKQHLKDVITEAKKITSKFYWWA